MTKYNSLILRIALLTFTVVFFTVILTGSVVIWSFNKSVTHSLSSYLSAYIDNLITLTHVDRKGNVTIDVPSHMLASMPYYWQVSLPHHHLKKSTLLKQWVPLPVTTANDVGLFTFTDKDNTAITSLTKEVTFPYGTRVIYIFGVQKDIADAFLQEEKENFSSSVTLALSSLATVLMVLFIFIQFRSGILPLKHIQQELIHIHKGTRQSLSTHFPTEIQLLANEINKLVLYNAAIIERYQVFASNLAHALKTPLTILKNEAHTASPNLKSHVQEKTTLMLELIDRNLARVKTLGSGSTLQSHTEIFPLLQKITQSFGKLYQKDILLLPPEKPLVFHGNNADFYEIAGNLVENACKHAKKEITVSMHALSPATLEIIIEDDGPGIPAHELENVFKKGIRLDETKPGSGIGLTITKEITHLYHGTLALGTSAKGGVRAALTLPAV